MIAAGDTDKAVSICNTFQQNFHKISYCLLKIGEAQNNSGNRAGAKRTLQQAFQAANKVKADSVLRNIAVLREIGRALVKAGDIKGAFQNVSALETDLEKISVLQVIARALAESGDLTAAKAAVQQALSIIKTSKEKHPSLAMKTIDGDDSWKKGWLGGVASLQAEIGDVKGALQSVEAIKGDPEATIWLLGIARAQAKAGDIEGALKTYQTYKTAKDHSLDYLILTYIAVAQAKTGDSAASKKTFQEAFQVVGVTEEDLSTAPLLKVPSERAINSLVLGQPCCTGSALREIAKGQAGVGNVDDALVWSTEQQSPKVKASALLGVAEGVLDQKGVKYPKAVSLYDKGIP